ncbi:MAG: aspartate aminotransferase family protein [Planctomycetes bacterium]|nr:aspartate aminotransferase family protein [Planctomycetota bacterium]
MSDVCNLFQSLFDEARRDGDHAYAEHVNPHFAKLLRTTGFDRVYVRGAGPFLYDEVGHEYIDCIAGFAVHALGRSHPDVVAALQSALASGHPGWVQFELNPLAALLAKRLSARMPGDLRHALFTSSGTEAVECAIKLARRFTGRDALLHCDKAFHGLTLGALAANGNPQLREGFGTLGESQSIPFNDLAALERALASRRFAAFLIEPVQGKTCLTVDDGYLAEASRLCRAHGTLLVVDEIQTGIGRTGKFLAMEHDPGCIPDIVVLSKALSGGFVPVGAALVRGDVWRSTFDSMSNSFIHTSTFQGGTLAMVAALTTLQVHDRERLSENADRMGARLHAGFEEIALRRTAISSVRGRGLMIGVGLDKGSVERAIAAIPGLGSLERSLFGQAFAMEILARHRVLSQVTDHESNVLKFTPPLVIGPGECDRVILALDETLARLSGTSTPFLRGITRVLGNLVR